MRLGEYGGYGGFGGYEKGVVLVTTPLTLV